MMRDDTTESRADDLAGIRQAAMDYMQGWYEGDVERMRRCLHPELAKRAIRRDPRTGEERFRHVSKDLIVDLTRQGGGSDVPAEKRYYETTILDVYGEIACAKAESYEYVDYLHLARCEGKWLVVNVLFEVKTAS
jgi:predicted lipid-binding transport protein (Tim44 family)